MNVQKQIARHIKHKGITISHIAKNTGITYELLRASLNAARRMSADEFVKVCKCLGLEIKDFDERSKANEKHIQ